MFQASGVGVEEEVGVGGEGTARPEVRRCLYRMGAGSTAQCGCRVEVRHVSVFSEPTTSCSQGT